MHRTGKKLVSVFGITTTKGGGVQPSDLTMALMLFLPGFVILLLLGTYPIFNVITLAFKDRSLFDPVGTWTGFDNFVKVIKSPLFSTALINSIVFTVVGVILQTIIGLGIALLLNQSYPGRNIFRGIMLFSYVVPMAVAAIIWRFMLNDAVGILPYYIEAWNLPIPNTWFTSAKTAMVTVILIGVWKFFPFMVINFLARLQTIELELYDAARVDGANSWQSFRHITIPMLMPVVIIVVLLRTIWLFNNWSIVALLTEGGPRNATLTLPILIHSTLFWEFSIGRAAATAFLMFVALLITMYFYMKAYGRAEERLA